MAVDIAELKNRLYVHDSSKDYTESINIALSSNSSLIRHIESRRVYLYQSQKFYCLFDSHHIDNFPNFSKQFLDQPSVYPFIRKFVSIFCLWVSANSMDMFKLLTEYEFVKVGTCETVTPLVDIDDNICILQYYSPKGLRAIMLCSTNPWPTLTDAYQITPWYLNIECFPYLERVFREIKQNFDAILFEHKLANGLQIAKIIPLDDKANLSIKISDKLQASAKGTNIKFIVPHNGESVSVRINIA